MSAAEEIADLDEALLLDGEDVVLRRVKGSSVAALQNVDVTCRAFVRGFTPRELVGSITLQDRKVILSPTQIDEADWPADEADSTSLIDPRIPRKNRGDKCVIGGKVYAVESAEGILIDGTLVRINMVVRG